MSIAIIVNVMACLLLNFRCIRGFNGDASTIGRVLGLAVFTAIIGVIMYMDFVILFVNGTGIMGGLNPAILFLALPGQIIYFAIADRNDRKPSKG